MFASRDNTYFHLSGRRNNGCTWLKVGGNTLSDPAALCKVWLHHFEELAKSNLDLHSGLTRLERESLTVQSAKNEEYLLDTPFTAAEVCLAVNHLKRNKTPGPDG